MRLAAAVLAAAGLATAVAAGDSTQRVKLDKHGKASISGRIEGSDTATFVVSGKKGAKLSMNFSSSGDPCGFNIYGPGKALLFLGGTGVGAYSGKFDSDSKLSIKVSMRKHGSCNFDLSVKRS